ncbi:PEK protein kinase [Vavraia culicis subsp. floridensis]|uniref:PEK protein kinase n=1 Tax=Vavraia culicis (isolate floridensis) TaxID=948595 RepID=L2GQL1_VAVCU|nr:PEK protein kinase [Vavraia culicis subsp. floridensis]ELA45894.1 PEK protein kinase [Vavraia culicis subsp. floridensis]
MTLKDNYWRDFKFTQKLGQGTHASVYKMMNVHTGQHFALKEINLCCQEDVHNECLPRHITHKNIIKYTKLFMSERPEQLKDVITGDNDEQACSLDMGKLRDRMSALNEHSIFSDSLGSLKAQGCEKRFYYMVCDYCEFTLSEFIAKRNELFFYGKDLKGMLDELSVDAIQDDKKLQRRENDVVLINRTKGYLNEHRTNNRSWHRYSNGERRSVEESNRAFCKTGTFHTSVHNVKKPSSELNDKNLYEPAFDTVKKPNNNVNSTLEQKEHQNVIYFDTGDLFTQEYKKRCNRFLKCSANVLMYQNKYFYLYNSSIINYQNKKCINRHFIALLFKDIVRGILYLHSNNIFHCDIKSNNILLKHETVLVPKISDFGLRRGMKCKNCHYKDVYDCGILYFEMLCPVKTVMEMDILRTRLKNTGELPEWFVDTYGEEAEIIKRCMSKRRTGAIDARHLFKRMIELCKRI